MTHPLPVGIFSILLPLVVVGVLVICTRWLMRSFHPPLHAHRISLLTAAFLLGSSLAFRFAFRRYQYNADWQMVGVPIPAVWLERTLWPNGIVFWKDWIGWPMPIGFLGNILFWVLLPTAPLSVFVWLFQRFSRQPLSPST